MSNQSIRPEEPSAAQPLVRLPDGTIKQVSPMTGTVVWTIPGRAHRPLAVLSHDRRPADPSEKDLLCGFCAGRHLETPPEKSRLVAAPDGSWSVLDDVPLSRLTETVAEFRRIPNLFEILSVDYWRANHGYVVPDEILARADAYMAEPRGRAHVLEILRRRAIASGTTDVEWAQVPESTKLIEGVDLFAGSHDVIVARRHLVDGATYDDELAGSGTLTPQEHHAFLAFTITAMRQLYASRAHVRYVAVFQNWLAPAGASFDHLHKQLVALDEHGPQTDRELARLRDEPDIFTTAILDHAVAHRLVVAENDHAIAIAGVGHRYPSLEVYSRSEHHLPWNHTDDEVHAVSDLLHAVHAATGVHVPTNEEWYHRPPDASEPMPWHIVLKWRTSTLAGFEGGTKININTVDPATLRYRVVKELSRLREAGAIADMRIGDECSHLTGTLRYAQGIDRWE
ncbi:hypothetical protein GALL_359180 [mine drainage metagenome]|uniref:DUF4921 domain-containing protein n=1 Tax=mine drainage metagenome TaxID=410659 RepID=A0A1J5QGD2_9ZZZZ